MPRIGTVRPASPTESADDMRLRAGKIRDHAWRLGTLRCHDCSNWPLNSKRRRIRSTPKASRVLPQSGIRCPPGGLRAMVERVGRTRRADAATEKPDDLILFGCAPGTSPRLERLAQ